MSDKKIERNIRIKPFVKYVNYNHIILTRYFINFNEQLKNLEKEFLNQGKLQENGKSLAKDPLENVDFK